jgi:excisionase family DNA binding protein
MPGKKQAAAEELNEEMLSLDQAAQRLGVSRSTLQRMLRQGNIRGFKVGRQWRFRQADLSKFGKMTHPSAAGVRVSDVERLASALAEQTGASGEVQFESPPPAFPATEEETAVDRLLQTLLAAAARANASDIHLDPTRHDTLVRFRIDGVLHQVMELPRYVHRPTVVAIKQHSGLALDQEQTAQDGRFRFAVGGTEHDTRVATLPVVHGESVVMRLLPQVAQLPTLEDAPRLGLSEANLQRFKRSLHAPCGIVLVSGPSGCGKTTLLYAGLNHVVSPEIKTITIEDPVEFAFGHWVTQASVNVRAGFTFEQAMRAVLRHDPDVIIVGDIRTVPVAEAAVRCAMTGHLVAGTIHANSAAGAIWRLLDLGLEPFALAESLICVVSIRLVRLVCPQCGAADQPSCAVLAPLIERAKAGGYRLPESPKFRRGTGCESCRRTGYRGRIGIYEVMEISPELQRLVAARAPAEALREAAVTNGMTTLTADGLRKAAEGITSLAEVARLLPEEPA